MRLSALTATAIVLAACSSAHAVQITVMAVNTNPGVAGYKAYTIGVKVTSADVTAGGAGAALGGQFQFTGGATGPYQAATAKAPFNSNQADIQGVQATFVDPSIYPPSTSNVNAYSPNGIISLFQDSWWYNSNGTIAGALYGYNTDSTQGVVTTGNSSGTPPAFNYHNYNATVGPTANVGTTGYTWQSSEPLDGGVALTTGGTMTFKGYFGPLNFNHLDEAPLSSLFSGGSLTVPLAQILVNGNTPIFNTYNGGLGALIAVGDQKYDLWGAAVGTDTALVLDFTSNTIHPVPEPATFALAGLGLLGVSLLYRRRGKKS